MEDKKETKKETTKKEEVKKEETKKVSAKKEQPKEVSTKKEEIKKEEFKKVPSKNKNVDKKTTQKVSSKSKKGIMIIAIIALILIVLIGVGYPLVLKNTEESSLKEIDNMFTAMKSGDEETINKYFNEGKTTENSDEQEMEMAKIILSNLEYQIVSTDVSLNENVVKLNVTNKNLKEVFSNYVKNTFSLAVSRAFNRMTEEEMNEKVKEMFKEQYNSEDIEKITKEITITMKKESGKWKIETDEDEFVKAILPEYQTIVNSLDSTE